MAAALEFFAVGEAVVVGFAVGAVVAECGGGIEAVAVFPGVGEAVAVGVAFGIADGQQERAGVVGPEIDGVVRDRGGDWWGGGISLQSEPEGWRTMAGGMLGPVDARDTLALPTMQAVRLHHNLESV